MTEAPSKRWLPVSALAAICSSLALLVPTTASGAVTCSLASQTMTVSATGDENVFINRQVGVGASILFNGNDCTPAADVLNTNTIVINDGAAGSAIDISFEVANGGFAPGATPEIGSTSEIEIRLDLDTTGAGGFDTLTVQNGAAGIADTWRAGGEGINLNAPEPTGADEDLTGPAAGAFPSVEGLIALQGFGGDDEIRASGGQGTGPVLAGKGLRIEGGDGDDQLEGGNAGDGLKGGTGDDSIDGAGQVDLANYDDIMGSVTVDLGLTGPQDTGAGGVDTITSVTNLRGSEFADDLTGNSQANGIGAAGGADIVRGGLGDDDLSAQDNPLDPAEGDTLAYDVAGAPSGVIVDLNGDGAVSGGQGIDDIDSGAISGVKFTNVIGSPLADTIVGDAKDQTLTGGDGGDTITGGLGADSLFGDADFDALLAQDGIADSVSCGADLASVLADDGLDAVSADCIAPTLAPTPETKTSTPESSPAKKCAKKKRKKGEKAAAAAKKKKKGCKKKKRKK